MSFCRLDLQGLVGLALFVVMIKVISNSIAFSPSCSWGQETPNVCFSNTSGKIQQISQMVELEYCYELDIGDFSFWSLFQIGLNVNWQPTNFCRLYGCGSGCLKITTPCNNGNPDPTNMQYQCVASKNGQDMRPLAVFAYPPFLVLGFLLMVMTKDLNHAQLAAILIIAFGMYNFERSVNIVRGCPWAQETYQGCGTGNNGQVKNTQTVTLYLCQSDTFAAHTPFGTNIRNDPECLNRGCKATQCLKRTSYCPGDYGEAYSCVDQQSEASAAPIDLFFSFGLMIFGLIVPCLGRKNTDHQPLLDN